jgi:hypothetical protein
VEVPVQVRSVYRADPIYLPSVQKARAINGSDSVAVALHLLAIRIVTFAEEMYLCTENGNVTVDTYVLRVNLIYFLVVCNNALAINQ